MQAMARYWSTLAACLLIVVRPALGQTQIEEPSAIFEFGAAGELGIRHGDSAYGPNFAAEVTPIEGWLEIEGGVTPFFDGKQTEWDTDLLFKKPYVLSDTVELMIGAGPEWAHSVGAHGSHDSVGLEAAIDFMIWPTPDRKIGWYFEPSYGYDFGKEHDESLGVSSGILIPVP